MEIYERIKLLRKTLRLTQAQFAEPLHMTQNSISSIEHGLRTVNDRLLDNISHKYGVPIEWLKSGQEPMFQDIIEGGIDTDVQELTRQYLLLTPEQRKVIRDMVNALLQARGLSK